LILTDREIQTAINRGAIIIDPAPLEKAYSSTGVDLTLDQNISIFKPEKGGIEKTIDPSIDNFNAEDILKDLTDPYEIPPIGYILN
jgi:dCTP deaminase